MVKGENSSEKWGDKETWLEIALPFICLFNIISKRLEHWMNLGKSFFNPSFSPQPPIFPTVTFL